MAERNGLLNRRTGHTVPWVRIPLSPPKPAEAKAQAGFFLKRLVSDDRKVKKIKYRTTGITVQTKRTIFDNKNQVI